MPRPIDHLVLAVPDLAAAAATYRALGFSVGTRNRHPWGTENHVVQLEGAFLEIIGLADDYVAPAPHHPAAPFAAEVEAAASRGGGLILVALRSEDAAAESRRLSAAGLGSGRMLHFGRTAETIEGERRELSFTLAFADRPALPGAGFFFCQHGRPEHFWSAAAQVHANGARSLGAVTLCLDLPSPRAVEIAILCDTAAEGKADRISIPTGGGEIHLRTPADLEGAVNGRFAAFSVVVPSADPVRRLLDQARIPYQDLTGSMVVAAEHAFGVEIAFEVGRGTRDLSHRRPTWT